MRVPRLTVYQIILEVLCLAALVAGLTLAAIKYPSLPAQIPNHFDAAGNVTDYAGKSSIWILEGVNILMYAMMTVFIFIPAVIENPNVTWKINPASRPLLARDTVSLLGETKLECVILFDWCLIPMTRGGNMSSWPIWAIIGVMTAGIILRLMHMKKVSFMR